MQKAVVVLLVALLIAALASCGYFEIEIIALIAALALICYICFLKAELKRTKAELEKAKGLVSQLNTKLIIANRQNESFRTSSGNKVVMPKEVIRINLSEVGEEQKAYGKYNVYGNDIALNFAPAGSMKEMKLETTPVSETKANATAEKIQDFLLADDPLDAICKQIGVSR